MSKYRTADYERLAEVFRALGNSHRLRIMVHLATCCRTPDAPAEPGAEGRAGDAACQPGAQCGTPERDAAGARSSGARSVGELGGGLSIVASTLSHHIHELSRAAVMRCVKHGKCVMCCIDRETLREISALFAALAGDAPLPAGLAASAASPIADSHTAEPHTADSHTENKE